MNPTREVLKSPPHVRAPRILVVDDEPEIRAELLEMFEDEGFDVVGAEDATTALSMVETDTQIGIVFSDLRMPGMDGIELAKRFRRDYGNHRALAVVVITGHGGMEEAVAALNEGVVDFVTKPFSFEQTTAAMQKALAMWKRVTTANQLTEVLNHTVDVKNEEIERLYSALVQRNVQLEAANRTQEHFLRSMSDELRTPLNHLEGAIGIVTGLVESDADDRLSRWLHLMAEAAAQLTNHVEAILELADVDATGALLNRVQFDVADVCRNAAELYRKQARLYHHRIVFQSTAEQHHVYGDRGRFMLALGYVIDNAIRHADGASRITIAVEYELMRPGGLTISVVDDGPGMTAEAIDAAFNPHRALANREHDDTTGIGLGLYLARRNMQLNGGELLVQPGETVGLQVCMRLPVENL